MKLVVEMQCDNEAFTADPGSEVARILRKLADKLDGAELSTDRYDTEIRLMDFNGNSVGMAVIRE